MPVIIKPFKMDVIVKPVINRNNTIVIHVMQIIMHTIIELNIKITRYGFWRLGLLLYLSLLSLLK